MKYQVKQKIFSIGDKFTIKNENDENVYEVFGKIFSLGHKLTIEDLSGNELVYIEQKLLKLLPQYTIFIDGNAIATVKKEFTFFKPHYCIDSVMGEYTMEGNILSHEFNILKDNRVVGTVSKEWFSFSDTYGVDIDDNENQAFILSLVIVIDEIQYDNRNKE